MIKYICDVCGVECDIENLNSMDGVDFCNRCVLSKKEREDLEKELISKIIDFRRERKKIRGDSVVKKIPQRG